MFVKAFNLKLKIIIGFTSVLFLSVIEAFIVTNNLNKTIDYLKNANDINSILNQIALTNSIIYYSTITIILFSIFTAYFIIHVITSKQKLELNHISETEKLVSIGRLSAGVAHEVNNPLADASLNIEMLKDDLLHNRIDETFIKKLEAIEHDIDRVSAITKELLQFSRSSESHFKSVDINNLIKSALLLLRNKLQYIKIITNLEELPEINGDPIKLEQVLLNILNNAAESVSEDGEIKIESVYYKGQITIEIADNGCGISHANKARIFDPFFTTKEVGKGTGLGLSIAYGIVTQHKGAISCISKKNFGTKMIIKFPIIPSCVQK
jgi:signal transduction histidine kinase